MESKGKAWTSYIQTDSSKLKGKKGVRALNFEFGHVHRIAVYNETFRQKEKKIKNE